VRRAALLSVHESPTIAHNLERASRYLRRQLEQTFPDVEPGRLDAVEVMSSWDAWNLLRVLQGCSVERARQVLIDAIRNLTGGTHT
jgi:hypothetical protein